PDTNGWTMIGGDSTHAGRQGGAPKVPGAVPNIRALPGPDLSSISVEWTSAERAAVYKLLRSTNTDPGQAAIVSTNMAGNTFTDSNLLTGITYSYWVQGVNPLGVGPLSAMANLSAPSAPLNLQATNQGVVYLTWVESAL